MNDSIAYSQPFYRRAIEAGLMQVNLRSRQGKVVELPDGHRVIEFISCSYLGLDQHHRVVEASRQILQDWGVHLCCARSRFSIGPTQQLEEGLSALFRGRSIVFPSVTSAHMATLPLLAAGTLTGSSRPMRVVYDRFAHASMQFLKPNVARHAVVEVIEHNDLDALREKLTRAQQAGEQLVYVADTVYSMGGTAPLPELLALARERELFLYLDDAHGTSVYGENGEGYLMSQCPGPLPAGVISTFSLAKGFGCNGGGVTLPDPHMENMVRCYGMPYAFSTPLDFSLVGAALASLELHYDGTVAQRQAQLSANLELFGGTAVSPKPPCSPIQMFPVGDENAAIEKATGLKQRGYFVSVAFYPVVPRQQAQLRACLSALHSEAQILGLREALNR